MLGSVGEFEGSQETWSSNVERFKLFLECNKVDTDKKVCTLFTVVGVKTYTLLRSLCTPDKPATKGYDDIVRIIQDHLSPLPKTVVYSRAL